MAQPPEDDEQIVTSPFPLPPPFYKSFTAGNLAALKDVKEKLAAQNDASDPNSSDAPSSPQLTAANLLDLPPDLRESLTYLIPPEPPTEDDEYRVFGKPTKISGTDEFEQIMKYVASRLWNQEMNWGTLPLWEYKTLYPDLAPGDNWSSIDRQTYLFRFLRSILLKHIELLGSLAQDPTALTKDENGNHILTLVMNMQELINDYRPHQARETLIRVLEAQVEKKKREIEGVRTMAGKVRETLEGFGEAVKDGDGKGEANVNGDRDGNEEPVQNNTRRRQREMWRAMDEILGH
ncbi:hypothetical protein P280DRAFT_461549 [Massarina eburnea CBS 473.64]|uniref:Mediator of RNA polymerase II transcription subunit 7 n=1 Tax=Massarina eburnea CBS 473.64 TaxID=1395130 RepID=A0A6A6RKB2_9PLEO|nr:hypothetical protein P280DRAFT_461549 [Massarina eburnea CBS 473.64]